MVELFVRIGRDRGGCGGECRGVFLKGLDFALP